MNTHLAIQRNPEHQRTIQACFSSPLPHAENWTLDNYALKFESWAHLNLDEINQRLNINYHQTDRKKRLQFCIFSFVMLNTHHYIQLLPPVILILLSPKAWEKHPGNTAKMTWQEQSLQLPLLLLLLSISEAVVLQKVWKNLTPFCPATIHKEMPDPGWSCSSSAWPSQGDNDKRFSGFLILATWITNPAASGTSPSASLKAWQLRESVFSQKICSGLRKACAEELKNKAALLISTRERKWA